MSLSLFSKNLMLTHLTDRTLYASVHTADPLDSGANETGAVRKILTCNPVTDGRVVGSCSEDIIVAQGETITHIGLWDDKIGGNFITGLTLAIPEEFSNAGGMTISNVEIVLN